MALHFAFVACNRNPALFRQDPSYRYRCENLARALEAQGHETALLHVSQFPVRRRFDVVVFHRPRYSLRLRLALALARRSGAAIVADVDDLVFDEDCIVYSPAARNGQLSLGAVRDQVIAHYRALALFERISVSTAPLEAHARQKFPRASLAVLPNAVYRAWRDVDARAPEHGSHRILTYLPGTRSHDRDFALVADALASVLARYQELQLHVTGPLQFDLAARPGQVVRHEKVPFERFHTHVQAGWVNLAPLESTPFTRCKSALKVLEAGYWGIPTVCSPIPDAERFIGAGALPAANPDEWATHIEALLKPEHYRSATEGLRERVLARADVDMVAQQFLHFVGAASAGL